MLNLAVIRSVEYYLEQVARTRADYYLGRGESPGRWHGTLAGSLGLAGTVEPGALRALLEGRHPDSGALLLPGRSGAAKPAQAKSAVLGAAAAADVLGVSVRTVQRWAVTGARAWQVAQAATPDRELRTPDEVWSRLAELDGASAGAGDTKGRAGLPTCLLIAPGDGKRRHLAIYRDELERVRNTRKAGATRQGYDVVFRPAKGWSVLWAVGPPRLRRELRRIHHEAVSDALAYLEDSAARGRATVIWRGERVRIRARGEGFVAACFDHRESRAGDPLLHTHCLIANVTRLPDGHLVALEASGLFRQQRAADAIYKATFLHLAGRRLGIAAVLGESVFPEPYGVPTTVIREFSKRSDEIAEEVARHGSSSAVARELAALATRRAKEVATRSEDLHRRWRAEADRLGFGEPEVAGCLGGTIPPSPGKDQLSALLRRLASPGGLTADSATFKRSDVVRALADQLGGAFPGPRLVELADDFLASEAVIAVREHRPGRPRGRVLDGDEVVDDLATAHFSVPELVAAEARLLAATSESSGPNLDRALVDALLASSPHLSQEQVAMVRSVCTSPTLLRPVVGLPGAGKTTATGALVAAFRAAGNPVVGCAVTATAADELARRSGLIACDTLARTLLDLEAPEGALARGTVVIADEASMLPTRDLDRLVDRIRAVGGTLVLVGDPHQHPAVGPGSFFAHLLAERLDAPALTGNLRRSGRISAVETAADQAMRAGRVGEALRLRSEADLLTRLGSPAELHARLIEDWKADWRTTGDPMIASSNDTRNKLNTAARKALETGGAFRGPVLVANGIEFRAGDRVIARRNDRRLRSRTDRRWWVRNGACGVIVEVDLREGEVVVDFDADGSRRTNRIRLPAAYVEQHLEHAYALTDYGVQGRTLARARAILDEASTAPGAYVASTRGRHENRLYVADGDLVDTKGLDTSHGIPRLRALGLDALAARVAARRPDGMLHDRDPRLHEAAMLAERHSLAELEAEAKELALRLASIPTDPTRSLENAEAARHRLRARLEGVADPDGSAEARSITASLARVERIVARLRKQEEQHKAGTIAAAVWSRRRDLLVNAIAMREAKERLGAVRRGESDPPSH